MKNKDNDPKWKANLVRGFAEQFAVDRKTALECLNAAEWNYSVAFDVLRDLMINMWGVKDPKTGSYEIRES